ncbi:MAG: hypothetical protein QOG49_691 [Frankiaceae bacterium]|nr:hypothetical protein [Frankiaceae bacterium]
MGLFEKAKRELGMVDKKLLANAILARGNVVSAVPDGMTIGQDANLAHGAEKVLNQLALDGGPATGLVLLVHRDGVAPTTRPRSARTSPLPRSRRSSSAAPPSRPGGFPGPACRRT